MITTQPLQINTRFNASICLSSDTEIILPKKLQLLAKGIETHNFSKPITYVVLTPTQVYFLCEKEVPVGSLCEFQALASVIHITNMYNKYLNSYNLRLDEISHNLESGVTITHRINEISKNLFINNHSSSMASIFGEAHFEDMPEWFRNGIWITQS
jgi:hypothetical protein